MLFSFDSELHNARLLWVALCQPRGETGWLVIDVSDTLPAQSGPVFGSAAQWWGVGLVIERAGVPIPEGAAAKFLLQGPLFVLTLILVCVFHRRVTAVARARSPVILPKVQVDGHS